MRSKLDIQAIHYINQFERTVGVKANYCFNYNSTIIFIIPKALLRKALGERASNLSKLSKKLNKKVKIITNPSNKDDLEKFISAVISPHKFKKISIDNNELTIFSEITAKAALIGKGKTKVKELSDILEKFFGIKKVMIK